MREGGTRRLSGRKLVVGEHQLGKEGEGEVSGFSGRNLFK